ncbi:GNAT family N-acetyltransferase [Euzebyella saccharophila]|uniref:GNAT family N-acetyltransferase n=1 Tax=Euzebyella saccharophila TaxID=679664 RepID=A0ABV8JL48_9FLAO|nr:GNAT family N-acetyltransferase [Euzebyella saccharophila]
MEIVSMKAEHWPAVSNIYQEGIATGIATFETQIPTYEAWDSSHMKSCRLVAIANNEILGWAALSPVSSRCVYGGVGEVSVYVSLKARGKGVGAKLMQKLIAESEANGLWTLQSGIFPENVGSRRLHEKMGFRFLGTREKIGKKNGEWKDNVLYERRSKTVGSD